MTTRTNNPPPPEVVYLAEAMIKADPHGCAACGATVKAIHFDHDSTEQRITADCPGCGRRILELDWR